MHLQIVRLKHYADVRENRKKGTNKYSKEYIALIGYCASYGGRYFDGGYGRDKTGKRNIYAERLKNLKEDSTQLKDIDIKCCDFKDFTGYKNCLFYFDPPYKGTKQYSKQFIDYNSFYDFLRKLSENNIVIISEYSSQVTLNVFGKKNARFYRSQIEQLVIRRLKNYLY